MRIREPELSTEQWEERIGEQVRDLRIAAGLDQTELSESAGVSIGALRNLERGRGSTLRTLLRVIGELGREDWLRNLAPTVMVSPLDAVRATAGPRRRVYRPRESGS
jgi:transcriptional regulator with XRE-family HTH domain